MRDNCWAGASALVAAAICGAALAALAVGGAQAATPGEKAARALADSLLAPARAAFRRAERDDAKGSLPAATAVAKEELARLQRRIEAAPDSARAGTFAVALRRAEIRTARLAGSARFIQDLKGERRGWEAVAEQWNHTYADLAQAAGVGIDPTLVGSVQARALIDSLGRARLRCQSRADSVRAAWRADDDRFGLEVAARDTTIAQLQRQMSRLQQQLWEVQVRAGVAEADRSAAEEHLRERREREDTVRKLAQEMGKTGGEVLLAPGGAVTIRVGGLAFPTGGAEIAPQMEGALKRLVAAVSRFPGSSLRVEGHTDDTGSREANLRLSRDRAEAVAAYLRAQLHLPESAVTATGYGPERPIADNATAAGRARNRRIDVVVVPPEGEGT